MGSTRLELRRAVGTTAGETLVLTATTAGGTSTFTDIPHLLDRETNAPSLINRIGYFSGGTVENIGHECRITAYNNDTKTLTFEPAAPVATQAGDELEIWSNWQRFGGIYAIHLLLNQGIRAVETFTGSQVYDTAQSFSYAAPELSIPSTWCEFGGADRQDRDGLWHDIPPAQLKVRQGLRTVQIGGRGRHLAQRGNVRLWGYTPAGQLTDDASETLVDTEWLVKNVTSAMRLGLSWRASDRAAEERLSNFWDGKATELRRKIGFTRPGMGVSLPYSTS